MFMTVTVDVEAAVLQTLSSWFIYTHTKCIEVTCRTGRRLVSVFGETVVLRMLREEEEDSAGFLQPARGTFLREGCVEPAAAAEPVDVSPPPYSAAAASIAGGPRRRVRVQSSQPLVAGDDSGSSDSGSSDEEDNRRMSPAAVAAVWHHADYDNDEADLFVGHARASSPCLMRCLSEDDDD